jgi:hypothetical protein
MVAYVAQTKSQLEIIASRVSELPYFVKPFIGEIDMHTPDVISEKHAESIAALEQFYIENEYFINRISVYSMSGDVFNLYRYDNDYFIIDVLQLHSNSRLRTETGVNIENRTLSIVVPVYRDGNLTGNVAVNVDLQSLLNELNKPFNDNENIWQTTIINEETAITLPVEDDWNISHEKGIISGVCEQKSGFLRGSISGTNSHKQVVSYFENLMIPEQNIGIAFSSNISPLILSAWISFFVVALVFI